MWRYRVVLFFATLYYGWAYFLHHLQRISPLPDELMTSAGGWLADMDLPAIVANHTPASAQEFMVNMKEWFPPATYLTDWIGAPSATDGRAPGEGEEDFMPGLLLAEQGLSAKHPVFLIPGIISTGLEVWSSAPDIAKEHVVAQAARQAAQHVNLTESLEVDPDDLWTQSRYSWNETTGAQQLWETAQRNLACGKRHFRKRFWGTMNQFRGILMDRECWVEHMALDEHTWLDRPGVKVRAAQGFDAADYLYPGYWVWARIISNLAALGYSPDTMHLASYDWRLSFANLEKRDRYFTRLKSNIEAAYENAAIVHGDGEGGSHEPLPVVVITHSMGALVFYYFLNWVRSPLGANAGEAWCDKYLKDWVNIGGPLLGLPKTLSALFTGESKDTTELGTFGTYVFERFFSKRERAEIFRRWPGLSSMNCKGGETLWGTPGAPAPDEHVDGVRLDSFGRRRNTNITAADATADIPSPFVNQTTDPTTFYSTLLNIHGPAQNETHALGLSRVQRFMHTLIGQPFSGMWDREWDNGLATQRDQLDTSLQHPRTWANPLLSQLPRFPSKRFRIYSFYGLGLDTERAFQYGSVPGDRAPFGFPIMSNAGRGYLQGNGLGGFLGCRKCPVSETDELHDATSPAAPAAASADTDAATDASPTPLQPSTADPDVLASQERTSLFENETTLELHPAPSPDEPTSMDDMGLLADLFCDDETALTGAETDGDPWMTLRAAWTSVLQAMGFATAPASRLSADGTIETPMEGAQPAVACGVRASAAAEAEADHATATAASSAAATAESDAAAALEAALPCCRALDYLTQRVGVAYAIDVSQHDPATNLTSGVRTAAGDGTVPLLSLGYMPRGGWRHARYNPGGVPVITKEIPHARDLFSLRGGGRTADHVDILGNTQVLEDILYIAAGKGEERVFDQISSEIDGIARNVELPPDLD